ncbi:MAG TPA: DUF1810 domain-containing protein [Gemmatimonadales bacterium]|jgi:uncharacterized protein (DUF1810 family)|nr:DUF1810 domain-containing protein [Gemmatimonadales bacterium]
MAPDLDHFLTAQAPVYDQVLTELKGGRKRSHWMWFIFPQIAGLGFSETSRHYAIRDLDEARAYLAHPILGARLRQCAELVLHVPDRTAHEIFGSPDDLKLRSSATLFSLVSPPGSVFHQLLERFFGGAEDTRTMELSRMS